MILELTPEQIKATQERFAMANKTNSEEYETELVVDWMDDSVQRVRK